MYRFAIGVRYSERIGPGRRSSMLSRSISPPLLSPRRCIAAVFAGDLVPRGRTTLGEVIGRHLAEQAGVVSVGRVGRIVERVDRGVGPRIQKFADAQIAPIVIELLLIFVTEVNHPGPVDIGIE